MPSGMGSHQSHAMGKDEWLTPPFVLAALGEFDLDPCSPIVRPWETAKQHFTAVDNGLSKPWHGRVWCNPPYGSMAARWLARLADHGNGIALVFARTETSAWVKYVWPKAHGIRFLAGRLHFHHVDGSRAALNSGAPSALVAYGEQNAECLRVCSIPGAFVRPMREAGNA
jgi:hypothetical protein